MAFTRGNLSGFLAQCRAQLRSGLQEQRKLTFVIGNESADLDSMTSAIVYAYLRSNNPPKNAFAPLYIPITNISAADVGLRPEFVYALKHANLATTDLITLDDLPRSESIEQDLPPDNTRWVLVDHNALQGRLGKVYSGQVCGCIDHHDEENKVPHDTDPEPRIITKSGSCTSLIINELRSAWDGISNVAISSSAAIAQDDAAGIVNDSAYQSAIDSSIAQLALSSILIDTSNLEDKNKVTVHDIKAVEYLEAKMMTNLRLAATWDRKTYFDEISNAKRDIDGLSLRDILRKDYKQWDENTAGKLGIASVVKPVSFLVEKAESENGGSSGGETLRKAVVGFARERDLAVFTIMTTSTDDAGRFRREILISATGSDAVEAAKRFDKSATEELGLSAWDDQASRSVETTSSDGAFVQLWVQKRTEHSRKRVAPLLREAMK